MAASDRQNMKLMSGGTGLLLIFIALGAAAAVMRLTKGLGAVTNLSDSYPWGLWIGFDVMAGVALAAGGFTITAAVYGLEFASRARLVSTPSSCCRVSFNSSATKAS